MDELLDIIGEAFGAAGFTVTDQESGLDFFRNGGISIAVPKVKKTELSKSIWYDMYKTASALTFTVSVRCFGKRGSFDDGGELTEAVSQAAGQLRGALMLTYLDVGELCRDASADRLRCDLLFTVKGREIYDHEEDD